MIASRLRMPRLMDAVVIQIDQVAFRAIGKKRSQIALSTLQCSTRGGSSRWSISGIAEAESREQNRVDDVNDAVCGFDVDCGHRGFVETDC